MENFNLNKDLTVILGMAYKEALEKKQYQISLENVMYHVFKTYASGSGKNSKLKKFFSEDLRKARIDELLLEAETRYKNSVSQPDPVIEKEILGNSTKKDLILSSKLVDIFRTVKRADFDYSVKGVKLDSVFLAAFEIGFYKDFLTIDEEENLRQRVRKFNMNDIIDKMASDFGLLKTDEDNEVETENLEDFFKRMGFGDSEKDVQDRAKKDDDEFDKAGQSSALSGKAIDPNSKTPYLDQFSVDMTKNAAEGKYDPVIGRDRELSQIIKILSCRKKNNAILLGVAGCGKSAIVESLAMKVSEKNVPFELQDKRICALDLNALVSGTKYRGEYEERLQGIIKEVCSNRNIIVYIDEFHNLIGNGGASGSGDGANILKPYLARGEFQCIGSTTQEEYRKFVKDNALKRRFQQVQIVEPGIQETINILKGLAGKYEDYHKVKYPLSTIKACVEMADRYINDRFFPDKAIDLLDTAGAEVKLNQKKDLEPLKILEEKVQTLRKQKMDAMNAQKFDEVEKLRGEQKKAEEDLKQFKEDLMKAGGKSSWPEVSTDDIAKVVSNLTGIPVTEVAQTNLAKLKGMKADLASSVIGQEEAVNTFVTALQRNYLGIRGEDRSIANLLLVGPTGTGKTLICQEVASKLFGTDKAFIKFNMGEFGSEHEVSKLIGSPAGYVGYEDEPLLLKVKRQPNCLVLFDEIEKAHTKIFDIFLNIMDKGEITLSNGENVDFRNAIVVFTGNIGTKEIAANGKGFGFNRGTDRQSTNEAITKKAIERTFRPEFINRLDYTVTFRELGKPELNKIFAIEIGKLKSRLKKKGYVLKTSSKLRDYIVSLCDSKFGARDLRRNIQNYIESSICAAMLELDESKIDKITGIESDYQGDKVVINFKGVA